MYVATHSFTDDFAINQVLLICWMPLIRLNNP